MKTVVLLQALAFSFWIVLEAEAGKFFFDDFGDERVTFPEDGKSVNWGEGFAGRMTAPSFWAATQRQQER